MSLFGKRKRMTGSEMIILFQSLSFMIQAGISVGEALTILIEDEASKINKAGPIALREALDDGMSLPEAFRENEDILGIGYWRQLEAANRTGRLPECFERLAAQIKNNKGLLGKVRGALAYPTAVVVIALVAGYVMFTGAIPEIADMMAEFDAELPILTQIMLGFSELLISYGVFIVIGFVLLVVWFIHMIHHRWKLWWDKLLVRIPIVAPIVINVNYAIVYRVISDMLMTGNSPIESLLIAGSSVKNAYINKELTLCYDTMVSEAMDLSEALGMAKTMPNDDRLMVSVGQKTSRTVDILTELAVRRHRSALESVEQMLELLNPIIMAVVCVFVGILVVSVYLPMITMSQVVS